jgi:hypothetical protein
MRMIKPYRQPDFCYFTCLFAELVYPLGKLSSKGLRWEDFISINGELCYANCISKTLRLSMISI